MNRRATLLLLSAMLLVVPPTVAHADATAFLGATTTPVARPARGFAFGVSLIVLGFEFEYANTGENATEGAPSLRTGMLNGVIQTPTRTQLYLTAGGGFYRERVGDEGETSFATNLGGGIKLPLAGPLRLRLDYRVFSFRGKPLFATSQRLYGGVNFSF